MQNGAFGWASSLSSSLAAQKAVSWSTGVGYQASLTDLFLKKNSLPFGSGISQLAAASSYLEKMSSVSDSHQSDLNQHSQHQQQLLTPAHTSSRNKCPHVDKSHKNQGTCVTCDVCPAEFHPTAGPSSHKSSTHHSFPDHSHHPPSDKSPMHQHASPSAPTSSPHHHSHHMPPPPGPSGTQQSGVSAQHATAGPSGSSCGRRSSNSANRSKNAPVKQFLCPVCHRTFTQKGNLKTHMMIHSGDKPYSCQICGKSFTQKGNVDTHMKIHTGEKDYNCRHCSKGFTQRGNLKTHERSVHTKEKPYACEICGKSFSQKGNMMTHLRTHNKDDRFPCSLCGKTFSQKGNLKTHMQRHSGTLPARRYGPRSRQNRVNAAAAAATRSSSSQFSATATESRASTAQKGSSAVDEESLSSVDHSLDSGSGVVHSQSSQNLLSPPVVAEAAHSALKHVSQSRDHHHHHQQQLQHQLPLPEQRNNPIAPIAMQFNSRFYSPSSSLSAPLAHTATWLASGAASAVAGITGSKGRQYDSFLSSYASFGQHHHPGQHLTRLTLLPPATHAMDHHHHHGHHHHGEDKNRDGVQMHQQAEYGQTQPQPNPDFSQLLD